MAFFMLSMITWIFMNVKKYLPEGEPKRASELTTSIDILDHYIFIGTSYAVYKKPYNLCTIFRNCQIQQIGGN